MAMTDVTVAGGDGFAARVEMDDLLDVVGDEGGRRELQALLDRHLVLHLAPARELVPEAFRALAEHLGLPAGADIADFSTPGRPRRDPAPPPREPPYIESLHYDGISAYSMQATFDTVAGPPNAWADMRAAYRSLPPHLRAIVDSGQARHGHVAAPGTPFSQFRPLDPERAKRRPLRIRHPRTGDPLLFLPRSPHSTIDGLPDDEGRAVLAELWDHVASSPARYEAHAGHNQLFVWDGLGTTHTNPSYPRERARRVWFVIIPAARPGVDPWP
jgi:alpha-ketoglutarate-dependent taurine dioxygenase